MKKIILITGLFLAGAFVSSCSSVESQDAPLLAPLVNRIACEYTEYEDNPKGEKRELEVMFSEHYIPMTENLGPDLVKQQLKNGYFRARVTSSLVKEGIHTFISGGTITKFSNKFRQYIVEDIYNPLFTSLEVDLDARTIKGTYGGLLIEGRNCK